MGNYIYWLIGIGIVLLIVFLSGKDRKAYEEKIRGTGMQNMPNNSNNALENMTQIASDKEIAIDLDKSKIGLDKLIKKKDETDSNWERQGSKIYLGEKNNEITNKHKVLEYNEVKGVIMKYVLKRYAKENLLDKVKPLSDNQVLEIHKSLNKIGIYKTEYNYISDLYEIKDIFDKCVKELKSEKYKQRMEEEKKKLDDYMDIVKSNSVIYIKLSEFILSCTYLFDNEEMSGEEYLSKLDKLIQYLFLKGLLNENLKLNFMYLNYIIEKIKDKVYVDEMTKRLDIESGCSRDDLILKYIEYYNHNYLNKCNIKILSNILGIKQSDTLAHLSKYKQKQVSKRKEEELENELFKNISTLSINKVDELDGYEFEDYLVELFSDFNYSAEHTPYSGDFGADIIIKTSGKSIAVQAKNYSGSVGVEALQEALSGKEYYKCDIAMVITNSYFTKQAMQMSNSTKVILVDRDKLDGIINNGKYYFEDLIS